MTADMRLKVRLDYRISADAAEVQDAIQVTTILNNGLVEPLTRDDLPRVIRHVSQQAAERMERALCAALGVEPVKRQADG